MKVKQEIQDKIVAAASALVAEGVKNPTNDQVRERMGGGSLSHISPVMREWRQSRQEEVVAALEIPSELKKIIESSIGQVWSAASKLASASTEAIKQEANSTIEMASNERDEALSEIARLESKIIELKKSLAEKQDATQKIQLKLDEKNEEHIKLTRDNASLSARLEDRENQIENLKLDLKDARDENKNLQSELLAALKDKK